MRTFDDEPIRLYRGPGWLSVFAISLITSFSVAVGVEWAIQRGMFPALRQAQTSPAPQEPAPARAAPAAVAPERGPTVVKVPMLTGMSLAEANQLAGGRGLKLVVREKRAHDLPADSVISQDPLPDSPVNPQTTVSVTLSVGKASGNAIMPDLTGQPLDQAAKALETAGFKVSAVTGPPSGPRIVKGSDPAAGQPVPPGTSIALTVVAAPAAAPAPAPAAAAPAPAPAAAAAPAAGVLVPKLVGMPWSKAKKAVEESGLVIGKIRERFDEDRGSYVVLEQTPAAGTQVAAGSGIDLVRNEGD